MGRRKKRGRRIARSSCCPTAAAPSGLIKTDNTLEGEVYTAIEYAGDKKECVSLPDRAPILMINSQTFGVLRCLADKYPNQEWGVYLTGEIDEDGDGICSGHVIPKQRVSSASVLPDSDVDNVVCWLHSHHGMGAWHSGTDREHANYPFIATVSLQNGKFDISAKKRFTFPCTSSKYILIDTSVQFYLSDAEEEKAAEENISNRPTGSAVITGSGQLKIDDLDSHLPSNTVDDGWPYYGISDKIPPDWHKYRAAGSPCKFGLEKSCQWQCRFATKQYYYGGRQNLYCESERAQAAANERRTSQPAQETTVDDLRKRYANEAQRYNAAQRNTNTTGDEDKEDKTVDRTKPFAPASKHDEALRYIRIGGREVVAVDEGVGCPAKGYTCNLGCMSAISSKLVEGEKVIFCVRKAGERRDKAAAEKREAKQAAAKTEGVQTSPITDGLSEEGTPSQAEAAVGETEVRVDGPTESD